MASSLNAFAAFAGFAAALLALRLSRAPGWRELGPAALVAGSGAWLGLLAVALADARASAVAPLLGQLRLAFGAAGVAAWLVYAGRDLGAPRPRLQRVLVGSATLAGLVALVPGLAFGPPVLARPSPALGVVYQDPTPTAAAAGIEAVLLVLLGVVAVRYVVAAVRRRDPWAALQAASFVALLGAAVNDVLAIAGIVATPYLLGLAAFPPVAVSTIRLSRRFALDAASLAELRVGLEHLAETRAQELAQADEELEASARLAELGRAAASIGASLADPAAAAEAGILRASQALAEGDRLRAEGAVQDALREARRLAEVVRSPVFRGPASSS